MSLNQAYLYTLYPHTLTLEGVNYDIDLMFECEFFRSYCFSFNYRDVKYLAHMTKDQFTLAGQSYLRLGDFKAYTDCSNSLGEIRRCFPLTPFFKKKKYRMNPAWIVSIDGTETYVEMFTSVNHTYYPNFSVLSPYCHKGVWQDGVYIFSRPTTEFTALIEIKRRSDLYKDTHPGLFENIMSQFYQDEFFCPYEKAGEFLCTDIRSFYTESFLESSRLITRGHAHVIHKSTCTPEETNSRLTRESGNVKKDCAIKVIKRIAQRAVKKARSLGKSHHKSKIKSRHI